MTEIIPDSSELIISITTQPTMADNAITLRKTIAKEAVQAKAFQLIRAGDLPLDNPSEIRIALLQVSLISPITDSMAQELMERAKPGHDWHEYYYQVVVPGHGQTSAKIFAYQLISRRYQPERMGQILSAILRSDLDELRTLWPDPNDHLGTRGKNRQDARDLVMNAAYFAFDQELFAYLDQRVHFGECDYLIQDYLDLSVRANRQDIVKAVYALARDPMRHSFWRRAPTLAMVLMGQIFDSSDPIGAPHQALACLFNLAQDDANNPGHLGELLMRRILERFSSPSKEPHIEQIFSHQCFSDLGRDTLLHHAHTSKDPRILFLVLRCCRMDTSDLIAWCEKQTDDQDYSWFGAVLGKKSAYVDLAE